MSSSRTRSDRADVLTARLPPISGRLGEAGACAYLGVAAHSTTGPSAFNPGRPWAVAVSAYRLPLPGSPGTEQLTTLW
jgi:hypothetical protein